MQIEKRDGLEAALFGAAAGLVMGGNHKYLVQSFHVILRYFATCELSLDSRLLSQGLPGVGVGDAYQKQLNAAA